MRKVAITGNIAAGKSAVEDILKSKGFKILDTDVVGHEILEKNEEVRLEFQEYDVFENGKISREKLGKLVFSDKSLLEKLNSITHPLIRKKIEEFFADNSSEEVVFVAIPLLFEAGMEDMFGEIIIVIADDNIRLKRLMKRNGYIKEYAEQRLNSQMPQADKIKKSDIVINNNGMLSDLKIQIDKYF